jgi:transposase-like protein
MDNSILQEALALPADDRLELAERIRESLVAGGSAREPGECPRCGCSHVARRGRDADGTQRWVCRGCGRTFTGRTGGLLALSKLPLSAWPEFVGATLEGASLRERAKRCSVSLPTSWYMRLRLCDVMARQVRAFRGGEGTSVQVDELCLDESLKGHHPDGLMPREPHRHGGESRTRGLSRLKIGVVAGANDLGDCFCCVASRGKTGTEGVRRSVAGVDLAGSEVSTDMLCSYVVPLRAAGVAAHNRYNSSEATEDELGMVNALHSRLRGFLARFNGVSTRRLGMYLRWFEWLEQARRSDASRTAMLEAQAANGKYSVRRRSLFAEPHPFWDYWEGKRPVVDVESLYPPEVISGLV